MRDKNIYKAAVIGCGFIGSKFNELAENAGNIMTHAAAYNAHESYNLVSLYDSSLERMQEACKFWNIKQQDTGLDAVIAENNPDIVSICVPNEMHEFYVNYALSIESVKAIFCEKPITHEYSSSELLVNKINDKGILFQVNYLRRFDVGINELKQLIQKGEYGDCLNLHGTYTKGILHNGTHLIDLIRFLLGNINTVNKIEYSGNRDESYVDFNLILNSGGRGLITNFDFQKYSIFELDLLFENGRVTIKNSGEIIEISHKIESDSYSGYTVLGEVDSSLSTGLKNTALYAVDNIYKALTMQESLICDGYDALEDMKIATLALKGGAHNG